MWLLDRFGGRDVRLDDATGAEVLDEAVARMAAVAAAGRVRSSEPPDGVTPGTLMNCRHTRPTVRRFGSMSYRFPP